MCSDTSDIPCPPDPSRVGARVDLVSPEGRPLGKLIFLDPSAPRSATATHVRFVPHPTTENRYQDRVLVSIYTTGDLTRSAAACTLLRQFPLSFAPAPGRGFEAPLVEPLALGVGGDGIIGRRARVAFACCRGERGRVEWAPGVHGDGVVGFNSA